jgi:hypothetical protein
LAAGAGDGARLWHRAGRDRGRHRLWLLHAHENGGERDYLDHLFHLSLPPLLWFVAAVAIGEVTILRTNRHARLERRDRVARRNLARMTEAFDALSRTNRRLQVQIATESATLGHVIDTATRLSSADPADRREAIVRLTALAARTEDFTCYRIAGDEATSPEALTVARWWQEHAAA